jgi:hypothetical protein
MSALFRDKKLEELESGEDSWLYLATRQTYNELDQFVKTFNLNEINNIMWLKFSRYQSELDSLRISVDDMITWFLRNRDESYKAKIQNYEYYCLLELLCEYFTFEFDESLEVSESNFPTIVQSCESIEEERLEEIFKKIYSESNYTSIISNRFMMKNSKHCEKAITTLFDDHHKYRNIKRSQANKLVHEKLKDILVNNTWNIRSVGMRLSLAKYIRIIWKPHTVEDLDIHEVQNAFSKLLLLRLRAASDEPIYSLEGF